MGLDDFAWRFADFIFNGCFPSSMHDQLAGELVKARLMKASRRFDEALEVIDKTLQRMPKYPEALFLKAQILWEGYADYSGAKACLEKILQVKKMRNEKEKTIRRWSENMLKEMREEKRMQHRRAEKDKRRR